MADDNKPSNPIEKLWNWFGTVGGIIALSSMAETWASDIVGWKGFIGVLIHSYQTAVHPIFKFLLGWLPFDVPTFLIDYLVIGLIVLSSIYKARTIELRGAIADWATPEYSQRKGILFSVLFVANIITIVIWPVVVYMAVAVVFGGANENSDEYNPDINESQMLQWVGAVIFGFVLLLILNPFV